MKGDVPIETMSAAQTAKSIRKLADQVERGDFIAVAMAVCSKEGDGSLCCCVDQGNATPDLIDTMLHDLKEKLFESYEDGR